MEVNHFQNLTRYPDDSILGMNQKYRNDDFPDKIDLSIGAYRDDYGKPYIFKSVRQAEQEIYNNPECNKEYLPVDGINELTTLAKKLLFENTPAFNENRICTIQSLSGTGALRLCAEFLKTSLPHIKTCFISNPTWTPHSGLFGSCGITVKEYPYYNWETKSLDTEKMCQTLETADSTSIVILHTCAHNPTGLDLSKEDWTKVIEVVKRKKCLVMMDTAYHGFATGNLYEDAWPLRQMEAANIEFFVAQSFAKNFGLYGERIGMFHAVCKTPEMADDIKNNLKFVSRFMYSTPPCHGAFIVQNILSDPEKFANWKNELEYAAKRVSKVREQVFEGLRDRGTPGDWSHLSRQRGMFSFTGLTENQATKMVEKYHIYMLKNGRISLAGLNPSNIDYFIDSFDDCVRTINN